MRPANPTAAELQRMPWHAREALERRLRTRPVDPPDVTKGKTPAEYTQDYIRACHRRFSRGEKTPAVLVGEREYQRRQKAQKRGEQPPAPPRKVHITWDIDQAIRLRDAGYSWRSIARLIGANDNTVRKYVPREIARRAAEAGQGEAA